MDDYYNILLLDKNHCIYENRPEKYDEIKEKIISLIKDNDFSLSFAAIMFKSIISDLGNTPINKL